MIVLESFFEIVIVFVSERFKWHVYLFFLSFWFLLQKIKRNDSHIHIFQYFCQSTIKGAEHLTVNHSLHKKWSFPLRISSVNVIKSAVIYNFLIFTLQLCFSQFKDIIVVVFHLVNFRALKIFSNIEFVNSRSDI